jgi:hypothetical protein
MAGDETADLAAQLDALRSEVASLRAKVAKWDQCLEEGIGATLMGRLELKQLRRELREAISANKLAPPPPPFWPDLNEAEAAALFAGLRAWTDEFLRRNYAGYVIKPCWAAHDEAIWELSTLRAEWLRIYGDPDNRDLAGAVNWHDRLLPGAVKRLAESIRCDAGGCERARNRR